MTNKNLSNYILKLTEADQGLRKLRFKDIEMIKGLPNYLVYAVDGVHNYKIKCIIEQYDYPTQKLIGKRAMHAFWLLVQHQDFDLKLQKACLENCNFEPKEKALLADRILVNSDNKQIYGTQFYRNEKGQLIPRPIKDKKNLDKRRKSAGLEPFAEYLKKMKKVAKETLTLRLHSK